MRRKSHYTVSELELNLYTFGKEWQLEDGTEYVGLYHRYKSTGEVFTRPVWNASQSKPLFEYTTAVKNNAVYKTLNNINVKGFITPKNTIIVPTAGDRKNGYFTRYFLKKVTDGIIQEVDQKQYNSWKSNTIDKNAYTGTTLKWYISGELNDQQQGSIMSLGVESKNRNELKAANFNLPGLVDVIDSLVEYYLTSDVTTPKDING